MSKKYDLSSYDFSEEVPDCGDEMERKIWERRRRGLCGKCGRKWEVCECEIEVEEKGENGE